MVAKDVLETFVGKTITCGRLYGLTEWKAFTGKLIKVFENEALFILLDGRQASVMLEELRNPREYKEAVP